MNHQVKLPQWQTNRKQQSNKKQRNFQEIIKQRNNQAGFQQLLSKEQTSIQSTNKSQIQSTITPKQIKVTHSQENKENKHNNNNNNNSKIFKMWKVIRLTLTTGDRECNGALATLIVR